MSDLQNQTPASTYKGLLQVGDYIDGVDSTAKYVSDGEGTPSALSISESKVGVGTTIPESELHIDGDITFSGTTPQNQGTRAKIVHTSGVDANGSNADNDGGLLFKSYDNSTAVDALAITYNGRCGISTTNPDYKLHVQSGAAYLGLNYASNIFSGSASNEMGMAYSNKLHIGSVNSSGSPQIGMTLEKDGNIGIGVEIPRKILHIAQAVNGDSEVTLHNNDVTSGSSAQTKSLSFAFAQTGSASTRSVGAIIRAGKEQEWTSSSITQDGYISLQTAKGSTLQERMRIDSDGNVLPGTDDTQDFGSSSKRWDDIYATNTTIQSSDRELKQDIEELSEAETRVAQACKGLLRKYRWKDQVATKGDEARIHFGIIAQDLEDAFTAEGLDAGRYGMFVKNTWWTADRVIPAVEAVEAVEAVYDEEGNEVSPAVQAVEAQPERTVTEIFENSEDAPEGATEVTQRGVRYAELLAFIIAAI
jgi:hypothetical protein